MDKIIISRLNVFGNHGVFEEENINGQNFYVSAEIGIDALKPSKSDELSDSVNYAEICTLITDWMKANTCNLIETVAHNLAILILEYSELVKSVKIRIDKPEAPIGLPFDTVAVEIERSWHTAYIATGSNMGDSMGIIQNAIIELNETPGITVLDESPLVYTVPYGGVKQDDFLNGCVCIKTRLNPHELLDELHKIESNAGRTREVHWGPRTLDLDIIFYDELVIHTKDLIIPHVDMANRLFVLEPMMSLNPYAYNPVTRMTVEQMYNELQKNNGI